MAKEKKKLKFVRPKDKKKGEKLAEYINFGGKFKLKKKIKK